tara:strand:+ start:72 stop:728 length:657 start_codon:yes stop_codon:yes gene_type:complete
MFTGLIQEVGNIYRQGNNLKIIGGKSFSPLALGDSISVDGVCLTVADIVSNGFYADVSEETLSRTTLGKKSERNDFVNLEPALRLSDRLGGHLVSGHVDGLGKVISVEESQKSWNLEVRWNDPVYGRYICEKGSICIDGISLTIADCSEDGMNFSIAVIPHTWTATSLKYLSVGDEVNLEADLMAKYAESLMRKSISGNKNPPNTDISKLWLESHGWS